MSFKQKHEKFARTIHYTIPENFLDSLSTMEYALLLSSSETPKCLVPNEANFQLPNIFLKTRSSSAVEKLFSKSRCEDNFNAELDAMIEFIDQIEFDRPPQPESNPLDEKTLEILIKHRH